MEDLAEKSTKLWNYVAALRKSDFWNRSPIVLKDASCQELSEVQKVSAEVLFDLATSCDQQLDAKTKARSTVTELLLSKVCLKLFCGPVAANNKSFPVCTEKCTTFDRAETKFFQK